MNAAKLLLFSGHFNNASPSSPHRDIDPKQAALNVEFRSMSRYRDNRIRSNVIEEILDSIIGKYWNLKETDIL